MRVAVISPHLDDAVFSVGEHMLSRPDDTFAILTPAGCVPVDEPHKSKYRTLLAEHREVCKRTGWLAVNGPFYDDAAGGVPMDVGMLADWFSFQLGAAGPFEQIWTPFGIHHPDHIATHIAMLSGRIPGGDWLTYEELPYRVLYPYVGSFIKGELVGYDPAMLEPKRRLCRLYASQIDDQLERCLYAPERLWRLT